MGVDAGRAAENDTSFRMVAETPSPDPRNDKRRNDILEAAFDVFADKGFRDATVADIAKRLRIGHGTVYRYFENKLHIFDQVLQGVIVRIGSALVGEAPDATDDLASYRAQVKRIAERLIGLLHDNPRATKLLFIEASSVSAEMNHKLQGLWTMLGQVTDAYLSNGKRKGFLRQDLDTTVTALAINAMIFEAGRQLVVARLSGPSRERWIQGVMALMFDGVSASKQT